jgi:hypothetical protein
LGVLVIGGKMNPDGTMGPTYTILPGVNELPREAKEFLNHPQIEEMIENGELVIEADSEEEEFDITKIPQAKAIKLVAETFSIKTLRAWEEKTTGKLLKAVQKQIKEMTEIKEEEKEEVEDGE